ncbi:Bromodomain-containing protein, partial [Ramicandelaber brevisporus]
MKKLRVNRDFYGTFNKPVLTSEAPGYYDVIQKPMCFEIVEQKMKRKEYRTKHEFEKDLKLICSNCLQYN